MMTHPPRLAGSDPGLQSLLDELVTPMGFEVVCARWTGQGKYRILRLFIDRLPLADSAGQASPGQAASIAGSATPPDQDAQAGEGAPKGKDSHIASSKLVPPAPVRSEVSLQDCAQVSRMLSLALDAAESSPEWAGVAGQFKAAYTLEVSSPGIERPLTKPAHFQRFSGHKASVRCEQSLSLDPVRKTFSGQLLGLKAAQSPDPIVQLHDEQLQSPVEIPLSNIRKAHLLYEGSI